MPRQFFTAADIILLARQQNSNVLVLSPEDVITQEAEDVADALGIRLVRETAGSKPIKTPISPGSTDLTSMGLPPLKVVHGAGVSMEPFRKGLVTPGTNVQLKDVVSSIDGSPMAAGFMTLDKGEFSWTLTYDEMDVVLEGELVVTRGGEVVRGGVGDVIFIPKGSNITFGAPDKVRFVYVTFPANWN